MTALELDHAEEVNAVLAGARRWAMFRGEALGTIFNLPDACVDAIITDPPYSSGGAFRGDRIGTTATKYVPNYVKTIRPDFTGDNRDQRSFQAWCALWLYEALRVAKVGSPICVFADWRQVGAVIDAVQAGGWIYRGLYVWNKTEGVRPSKGRFMAQTEFVVWGSSGPMPDERDVGCLPGLSTCFPQHTEKHHQTGKPIAVMQDLAKICEPDGIIFDPFAGSASTGVGALLEGRRFIGCELTEANYAIARERLEANERGLRLQDARAGQLSIYDVPAAATGGEP